MIDYQTAKKYLQNQWSIFPVNLSLDEKGKIEKKPAIAWREYQQRLPTDTELHQWFDKPQYNAIGLVTGKISHIIVVDVDDPSKDTFSSPMNVKTISGGFHYYYQWTEEIRNDAKINNELIDFRGDGGFVVLPPSSFGTQSYEWIKEVHPMFLTPLPEELKKLLRIRKEIPAIAAEEKISDIGLPLAYEGERNVIAAKVAGIICNGISRKLLPIIGFKAFAYWNKTSCNPPLNDLELQITWNSIYHTELRNHPDIPEFSIFSGDNAILEYKRLQSQFGEGIPTGFLELDKFFKFIPEQLYLLSAPTHHGKTSFALNIASRIAFKGERVLFASLEQGVFIAPRVETMLKDNFPETLSILTTHKMISVKGLIDAINEMKDKPQLIVIDHLHFIKKEGKGVTEDIDSMILDLQNMAKELHLPVFVIAHVRKLNADRPPELDDLRDSSSLSQVPSVVMFLYRKRNLDETARDSYLSFQGILLIAKNRIQGKTGLLNFTIDTGGDFQLY